MEPGSHRRKQAAGIVCNHRPLAALKAQEKGIQPSRNNDGLMAIVEKHSVHGLDSFVPVFNKQRLIKKVSSAMKTEGPSCSEPHLANRANEIHDGFGRVLQWQSIYTFVAAYSPRCAHAALRLYSRRLTRGGRVCLRSSTIVDLYRHLAAAAYPLPRCPQAGTDQSSRCMNVGSGIASYSLELFTCPSNAWKLDFRPRASHSGLVSGY